VVWGDARAPPPRSYFGYSQSPAKAQEALKEDEGEVEVEEDEGEESLFELTHEALGEREDEQELRKGQKNRQTDRQKETVSRSGSGGVRCSPWPGAQHPGHGGTPDPREGVGGDGGRGGSRTSVRLSVRPGDTEGAPAAPAAPGPVPPSAAPCL